MNFLALLSFTATVGNLLNKLSSAVHQIPFTSGVKASKFSSPFGPKNFSIFLEEEKQTNSRKSQLFLATKNFHPSIFLRQTTMREQKERWFIIRVFRVSQQIGARKKRSSFLCLMQINSYPIWVLNEETVGFDTDSMENGESL